MNKKLHIDFTPEIMARLKAHADKWSAHAMGTEPCDRERVTRGILGMYAAAKLAAPRVVFVSSPYQMALVYGAAAWWWYVQKNGGKLTSAATSAATDDATSAATYAATYAATDDATYAATRAATDAATSAATSAATYAATYAATDDATYAATDDAWVSGIVKFCHATGVEAKGALGCASNWIRQYQGGRMWGGWQSYLTAFRDMGWLKLKEYENFRHYEDAADAGFRCLHEKFCVVTDNPERIAKDAQNRPHCDDGPSHLWRDGWALYHVHGVRVPEYVVMRPQEITLAKIKAEENAEVRRVMIDRFPGGSIKYLHETKAKLLHADVWHGLPRGLFEDCHGDRYLYGSDNSTGRIYSMPVAQECKTCTEAHENICGFSESLITQQS